VHVAAEKARRKHSREQTVQISAGQTNVELLALLRGDEKKGARQLSSRYTPFRAYEEKIKRVFLDGYGKNG